MNEFKQYRRTGLSELTEWNKDIDMCRITVSQEDKDNGSPKIGDMIARNKNNHNDMWLVSEKFFKENLELVEKGMQYETLDIECIKTVRESISDVLEELKHNANKEIGKVDLLKKQIKIVLNRTMHEIKKTVKPTPDHIEGYDIATEGIMAFLDEYKKLIVNNENMTFPFDGRK